MSIPNIRDFLAWALTHAILNDIAETAVFPISREEIGVDPAHYLLGTIWTKCTKQNIKSVYERQYASQYSWEYFRDVVCEGWTADERATDCQGINDAFLRYIWEGGDGKTDTNANGCYKDWCGEKGEIEDYHALPLGAAVFKENSDGKKTHVGFICGFDGDEPLVLEAQGLAYGVKVNYLKDRPVFSHYGIMDKKYDYSEPPPQYPEEPLLLTVCKPVQTGEGYRLLQAALNHLGYTDDDGCFLAEDGKWGEKSRQAWDKAVRTNLGTISADITLHIDGVGDIYLVEEGT